MENKRYYNYTLHIAGVGTFVSNSKYQDAAKVYEKVNQRLLDNHASEGQMTLRYWEFDKWLETVTTETKSGFGPFKRTVSRTEHIEKTGYRISKEVSHEVTAHSVQMSLSFQQN
ncbi:MAG: hypothetical protein LBM97_01255 [Candidatus Nomurabacteria bacterium]|jgi:hypothetical protein|nr:hypothetical protein [Candidatus Nomurabacteria bacterium]